MFRFLKLSLAGVLRFLLQEYSKAGGRVLIKLPGEDIDFSPTFKCYLATRDPTCQFPPDVCSRVTFVNFTVTPSSMQSQAMSRVLKAVRPDVDEQHRAMLHAQGRFSVELRQLQDKLLSALAESGVCVLFSLCSSLCGECRMVFTYIVEGLLVFSALLATQWAAFWRMRSSSPLWST